MFWFYRTKVYQNYDFKKKCRIILKFSRFLRFFLCIHNFFRTFALPFKRRIFHRIKWGKICGEICLLATTRKNAKIVKMVSRDLTVCFYSGSAYFEIVKNMWSYFLSTNEMMRTQNVNYPVMHHRLVSTTTL